MQQLRRDHQLRGEHRLQRADRLRDRQQHPRLLQNARAGAQREEAVRVHAHLHLLRQLRPERPHQGGDLRKG